MAELSKVYVFPFVPSSVEELKALPEASLLDPMASAALAVLVLSTYPTNQEACFAMMDYLKGPAPTTPFEKQFVRDRFMDGRDYIPRSYFAGAVPENNYTPNEPLKITVLETAHSRDTEVEGYVTMYVVSGGADSPRGIKLRTKKSTGEWFVNDFSGILSGIRVPVSDDPWA